MGKSQLFLFEGKPVDYFVSSEYPREPGHYRYIPLRGPGHYELQKRFETADSPVCYYVTGRGFVSFKVRDCPAYGELVLGDFETTPRKAP